MSALLLIAALATAEAPTCHCETQCEAMWSEATGALEYYTGMRMRLVSDTIAETYVPRVGLHGTLQKQPLGNGGYQITALVIPRPNSKDNQQLAADGVALFNRRVQKVADREACPAK